MDSGNGNFNQISETKAQTLNEALVPMIAKGKIKGSGIFKVGEPVELKGSNFIVSNISTHKLTLTLQA